MGHEADPKGIGDPPNTGPMQRAADALRKLLVGEPSKAHHDATIRMAADIVELQTDWLMDQHRMIVSQSGTIDTLNSSLGECSAMIRELLGKSE